MKKFIALLALLMALSTSYPAAAKKRPPIKLQSIEEAKAKPQRIKESEGWVLVHIDASSPAPSIDVQRLLSRVEDAKTLPSGKKIEPCMACRDTNISFKNLSPGYYIFPMRVGVYQITNFNVPYYGLPYIQDTDRDRRFRFRVGEGAISYIGHIELQKERTSNSAEVAYLDRYATANDELKAVLSQLNFELPIFYGYGMETLFQMDPIGGKE